MKQYIFFLGLMASGIIAIEPMRDVQEVEDSYFDLTNGIDYLAKRIGIKPLIGDVIQKIEHLTLDYSALEKTFDNCQQELIAIKKKINDMIIKENRVIIALQREVKILKWALAINFGLIILGQAYFYYDQY